MKTRFEPLLKKVLVLLIILMLLPAFVFGNTKYGRLTGVNWFGFETGNYVVHGIWNRDYKSVLQQVKDLGFNCLRLPYSNEMMTKTPTSIQINEYGVDAYTGLVGINLDLAGLTSLQVMDKIVAHAQTLGLYIILDNHSRAADAYIAETLWYTAAYPESKWISDWVTMVNRYKSYSNMIGADLDNEPHGNLGSGMKPPATWGYDEAAYGITDWKAAAERCSAAILAANPNLLIIVEGVEEYKGDGYWWGGNLKGVADYPIKSIPSGSLVYSPHEYGSGVFAQTWFSDPTFPANMAAIWDTHFNFIYKQGIAPLLLGEFGITGTAAADPTSIDYKWLTTLMAYVGKNYSWTFWCLNPNSGDTGGILMDDWVTVNNDKMNILRPYLSGSSSTIPPTPVQTRTATTVTRTATATTVATITATTLTRTATRTSTTVTRTATATRTSTTVTRTATATRTSTTITRTATATTVTRTATSTGSTSCTCDAGCSAIITITPNFAKDGAGQFCFEAASLGSYINSWNMTTIEVNGVDFTNKWAAAASLPALIGGKYYVYYNSASASGHFEAMN